MNVNQKSSRYSDNLFLANLDCSLQPYKRYSNHIMIFNMFIIILRFCIKYISICLFIIYELLLYIVDVIWNVLVSIVNTGKNIGGFLKRNAKVGLLSGALMFGGAVSARASPGKLTISNNIDAPYTDSNCSLVHSNNLEVTDNYDDGYDMIYYPMYNPSGIASFIVSNCEDYNLDNDKHTADSTSDFNLSLGLISQSGGDITISSDNICYVSCSGFEGEDCFIDTSVGTFDAKTTSTITLTRLEGTYSSGSVYDTMTISFVPHTIPPVISSPSVSTLGAVFDNSPNSSNPDGTQTSATLLGKIDEDGKQDGTIECETQFEYWKMLNPFSAMSESSSFTNWQGYFSDNDEFSETISVEPNSAYEYTAIAKNSEGESEGGTEKFSTFWKDTLLIRNSIPALPENKQGTLTYVQKQGNSRDLDPNDIIYYTLTTYPAPSERTSEIFSSILKKEKDLEGRVIGVYELSRDARNADPNNSHDPNSTAVISLRIYADPNSPVTSENYLELALPNGTAESFKGKTLTIQQQDINDPNIIYPLWDVAKVINYKQGKIQLPNLVAQKPNVPYSLWEISTGKKILDINGDGKVGLDDHSFLLSKLGTQGPSRSDIASPRGLIYDAGLPDGKVDAIDDRAFIEEYNKENPGNPLPNPY